LQRLTPVSIRLELSLSGPYEAMPTVGIRRAFCRLRRGSSVTRSATTFDRAHNMAGEVWNGRNNKIFVKHQAA
jgi:hypothetical protein